MRKIEFVTLVHDNTISDLTLLFVNGYKDDLFFYYKSGAKWFVIHPETRTAVFYATTLTDAKQHAHSVETRNAIEAVKNSKRYAEQVNRVQAIAKCLGVRL